MTLRFALSRSPGRVRRSVATAVLISAWFVACNDGVDGNGERASEVRTHSQFSRIESRGSLSIDLTQSDTFSVEVSIDSNLLDSVITRVSEDTLIIDQAYPIDETVPGPHVIISLPSLAFARLSGSGDITAHAFSQPQDVQLSLSGSGRMSFGGSVPAVKARLSGSGEVFLDGSSDQLDLVLDGSGAIVADSLTSLAANVSLDGSGDIDARVNGPARVSLSGSGRIDLFGAADVNVVRADGSGEIHVH